jgi:predicted hotdog family 3-hydroxylacyl-ACP dehydratase
MTELAPIRTLVPHAPPMLWLRRVVAHDGDSTECEACTDDLAPLLDADGCAPGYAAIELAAQCVAVHARLIAQESGAPRIGYLLGARRFDVHAARLLRGQSLRVRVTRKWGANTGPASFDAELRDTASGALLAAGRISCFTPNAGDVASR